MIKKQPKIAIIILNWNGIEDTRACLNSLKKIKYPNYDIILVDNGSRYYEADYLEKEFGNFIKFFIKNEENLGFAGGNNIAIKKLLGKNYKYFLLLNNDTEVESNFLCQLVNLAESNKQIGIVGPKIKLHQQKNILWYAGGEFHWWTSYNKRVGRNEIDTGKYNKEKITGYVSGACLLIRKKVIEQIGLLDENFFSYMEDVDWCIRANKRNWLCCYQPKSLVWHKISDKYEGVSASQIRFIARNRIWLVKKNYSFIQFYLMIIILFIYRLPRRIFRIFFVMNSNHLFKPYLKGIWQGFRYKKYYLISQK